MKTTLFLALLLSFIFVSRCTDICQNLKCKNDEVCDREAKECVKKSDMTEGRPCQDHEDCRDDHICYGQRCIFFHGRRH